MKKLRKIIFGAAFLFTIILTLVGCGSKATPTIVIENEIALRTTVTIALKVIDKDNAIVSGSLQAKIYEKGSDAVKSTKSVKTESQDTQEITFTSLEMEKTYDVVFFATYAKKSHRMLSLEYTTSTLGSEENPHLITTKADFANIVTDTSGYFKLMNDLEYGEVTMSGTDEIIKKEVIQPIFNSGKAFVGNFDGNNKKISNFQLTQNTQYNGLFGYLGAKSVIKNLTIDGVDATLSRASDAYVGVLAGYNAGKIDNVHINNINVTFSSLSNYKVMFGGFVGFNSGSAKISNSSVSGKVMVKGASTSYIGGFVGLNQDDINQPIIESCFSNVEIKGGTEATNKTETKIELSLGGFVGDNRSRIKDCYAIGNIDVSAQSASDKLTSFIVRVGGFVGRNDGAGKIHGSGAKMDISLTTQNIEAKAQEGTTPAVSASYGATNVYVGGIAGFNREGCVLVGLVYMQNQDDYISAVIPSTISTDYINPLIGLDEYRYSDTITKEYYSVVGVKYNINEGETITLSMDELILPISGLSASLEVRKIADFVLAGLLP